MKTNIFYSLIVLLGLSIGTLRAQTLDTYVIGSLGGVSQAGGVTLSYTLGQTVSTTIANGSVLMSQGFQQSWSSITNVIDAPIVGLPFTAQAYPNPTSGALFLSLTTPKDGFLTIQLFNLLGQDAGLNKKIVVSQGQTYDELDLSAMTKGVYFLKLTYQSSDKSVQKSVSQKITVF